MASSNPLASAKAALEHAQNFTKSAEGSTTSKFAPPHEFSHAPYSMVKKPDTGIVKEASDAGQGIKWRAEQAKALDQ